MTNVFLYGELRNKFGGEFAFNINSAREAFLAVNANRKGFLDEIKKLAAKGIFYRVIVDDEVIEKEKQLLIAKPPKEIHIVPVVWGAGRNGAAIGMLVVGIALVAMTGGLAAIGIQGMSAFAGATATAAAGSLAGAAGFVGSLGMALAVQGAMTLLFPPPKPDFNQEVQAGGKSYLFGNKPSNASQGQAVPVGYGRLKIGSSQISSSVDHYGINADVKQLMAPVDKPIDDYTQLEFADEQELTQQDSFSTNQSAIFEEPLNIYYINVLNSYIDILTKSAEKVVSRPVEVVVRKNTEIISNPDLPTYDADIKYQWEEVSTDASKGQVRIENPYSFKTGIILRSYHSPDFTVTNDYDNITNIDPSYFTSYEVGDLVRFGPQQFYKSKFLSYDASYEYRSGELVNYPTGADTETFFQAKENDRTGFSGLTPTGSNGLVRTDYWRKILPPPLEYLYKCTATVTGHLPTTGALDANGAPIAETNFWTRVESPSNTEQMNTLFKDYPSYTDNKQFVHVGNFDGLNEPGIQGVSSNLDNYGMEFLGYFYVSVAGRIKSVYELGTAQGAYEIIKVGNTGQWSGLGLTGQGGVALTPRIGATFNKTATQGASDGKVAQVAEFQFKLDSDDAADLFIDQSGVSTYYGGHGMYSGFANPLNPTTGEIHALHSTVNPIYLTAGYHRLYARVQDSRGAEGITIYHRYDTDRNGSYSDWAVLPKEKIFYSNDDLQFPRDEKFLEQGISGYITPADGQGERMVSGQSYKIIVPSSTSWTQLGAASSAAGTVFYYNGGDAGTSDANARVTKDFVNYAQQNSAESNRLVRFVANRREVNGSVDNGYATYKARYVCKATIGDRTTISASPVRMNVRFIPMELSRGTSRDAFLPPQSQV
jgi:predicted phage tail protein